ncbi:MAG: SIR2 family protein [bacterium]|nr:SIR2 family protein [bacterium]
MHKLISALGSGRAVVFYGAGPSAEIGLPDWARLTTNIADAATEIIRVLPASISDDIAAHRFPKAIGDIERLLIRSGHNGRDLVERTASITLSDTGVSGSVYKLLAGLPVKLFMTTNIDSVFERHLRERRITPAVFTNSRDSLEEVDPASFDKSIIYIHGSLEHGGSLILSDTDYSRILHATEFKPLRETITAHLINSAIVILGYSLTDPDLRAVAQRVAANFTRNHRVLALVADANDEQAASFSREFNIEVIPYSSSYGHRELVSILSASSKWLEAPQVSAVPNNAALRAAQILYVYDAAASPGAPALLAAAKSLVLVALKESRAGLTAHSLGDAIVSLAGARVDNARLTEAIDDCTAQGLVVNHSGLLQLNDAGEHRVDIANRKYNRLWDNLADHAAMTIVGVDNLGELIQQMLVDLFSERASEAVGLALLHQPIETSSLSLFDLISQRARVIADPYKRLLFVEYVIDMLRRPNTTQRAIIEHLGRSLFCAHALRVDVTANRTLSSLVANRALLLDSNLLIPLVASGSPLSGLMTDLVRLAGQYGLALYTTHGFAQEVLIHVNWARRYSEDHPGDDEAILCAARGFGVYNGNDFLNGMILSANESGSRVSLRDYLRMRFGCDDTSMSTLRDILAQKWNIMLLTSREAEQASTDYSRIEQDTRDYISRNAASSKSVTRIRTEAEAYSFIHEWPRISESLGLIPDIAVLSSGGYLNRIAKEGPHNLGRNVTTTPYALNAVISTYLNSGAVHDFGAIMRSEFFNAASDFIEEAELERYFSAVISAADRAYEEDLRPRLIKLEADLFPEVLPETLSDIPPISRPEYTRGLSSIIADYTSTEEISRLLRGKLEAEKALKKAEARADKLENLLKKRQRGELRYKRQMANRKK